MLCGTKQARGNKIGVRGKILLCIRKRLRNKSKDSELIISFQEKRLTGRWPELKNWTQFARWRENIRIQLKILLYFIITNYINKSYLSAVQLNPWKSHLKKISRIFSVSSFQHKPDFNSQLQLLWTEKHCYLVFK